MSRLEKNKVGILKAIEKEISRIPDIVTGFYTKYFLKNSKKQENILIATIVIKDDDPEILKAAAQCIQDNVEASLKQYFEITLETRKTRQPS
jgi:hypothetical protein